MTTKEVGYLHFGQGTIGPYQTIEVPIRGYPPGQWEVRFEGRWRRVHCNISKTWVIYLGQRVPVQIWGV